MTDQSDQEILDLADSIRRNKERTESEEREKLESIRIKKLIGKFYSGIDHKSAWDGTAINIYRILPSYGWGEAKIERYFYYHGGHYGISVSSYNEGMNGVSTYDKEIEKHIFWHEVSLVLDRIGINKELNLETNH